MLILLFALLGDVNMLGTNNQYRASQGLPPQVIDARLQKAAQDHAEYMASHRSMNHYSNGGPGGRAAKYEFNGSVLENIAYGYKNPWPIWRNSSGHWSNIRSNCNVCGFGVAYSKDGVPYWCAVYGRVRTESDSKSEPTLHGKQTVKKKGLLRPRKSR